MNFENETVNDKAYLKLKDVTGNSMNIIEKIVLDNGFTYYSRKLFIEKYGMSERTLYRREQQIEHKHDIWRYMQKFKGYKTFYSAGMLGIKKKNLSDRTRADYIAFLALFDWDLIGSVRRYGARNIHSVRKAMEALNSALKKRFIGEQVVLWYSTETNPDGTGYHAHFVLQCSVKDKTALKDWIQQYLGKFDKAKTSNSIDASIHLEPFNSNDNWLAYITKQIYEMPDGYDLLTTSMFGEQLN